MKKFQFALMCAAALAFVACDKKGEPTPTPTPDPEPEPEFVSKISTSDKSAADWDKLPAEYVLLLPLQPTLLRTVVPSRA